MQLTSTAPIPSPAPALGPLLTPLADRVAAAHALAARLPRTTPVHELPRAAVQAVLDAGRGAVQVLRTVVGTPGLSEPQQRAIAAAYPHLHDAIHLLEDAARSAAPATPRVVLDAVELGLTRAWLVVDGVRRSAQ